jgi:hypothetical protein
VTIGIVDTAGNTVVASSTSTTSAGSGVYTYSLAGQSNLKELVATWSGTWGSAMEFTTTTEVVGNFYCSPAEVRAMPSITGDESYDWTIFVMKYVEPEQMVTESSRLYDTKAGVVCQLRKVQRLASN